MTKRTDIQTKSVPDAKIEKEVKEAITRLLGMLEKTEQLNIMTRVMAEAVKVLQEQGKI